MKTEIVWQSDMKFSGQFADGQEIIINSSESNDVGVSPMKLLLTGVAGCTGIDIVSILEKMRLELDNLKIVVEGIRAEDHPRRYTKITLKYFLAGKNLTEDKVKRAIELSLKKYCSASNSLNAEINYNFEIM